VHSLNEGFGVAGMYGSEPLHGQKGGDQTDRQGSVGMKECDSTSRIRLTDSVRQSDLDEDSMQTKRWAYLIRQGVEEYCVEGIDLLKAMEQSVEEEMSDQEPEATRLLTKEVVEDITKARESRPCVGQCDKKKTNGPVWGPVLVERQRRGQKHGGIMMQKAMEMKKRKNLELVKGNKFAALQYTELNQISNDIDVKIGHDKSGSINIINALIESKNKRCEQFVRDNPEVILPVNLDVCNIMDLVDGSGQEVMGGEVNGNDHVKVCVDTFSIKGQGSGSVQEDLASPQCSVKEPNSSEPWTEVVRRGKPKGKARGRSGKIVENEMGLLEY
jgi:hypothetical protein